MNNNTVAMHSHRGLRSQLHKAEFYGKRKKGDLDQAAHITVEKTHP